MLQCLSLLTILWSIDQMFHWKSPKEAPWTCDKDLHLILPFVLLCAHDVFDTVMTPHILWADSDKHKHNCNIWSIYSPAPLLSYKRDCAVTKYLGVAMYFLRNLVQDSWPTFESSYQDRIAYTCFHGDKKVRTEYGIVCDRKGFFYICAMSGI